MWMKSPPIEGKEVNSISDPDIINILLLPVVGETSVSPPRPAMNNDRHSLTNTSLQRKSRSSCAAPNCLLSLVAIKTIAAHWNSIGIHVTDRDSFVCIHWKRREMAFDLR